MSQPSIASNTPLNLLVSEIEATPPEYWDELLKSPSQKLTHDF